MAPKLFSSRIAPKDDWMLIRQPHVAAPEAGGVKRPSLVVAERNDKGALQVAEVKNGKGIARNTGIIVKVGPGGRSTNTGALIPPDPDYTAGKTVVFPGKMAMRPPDFEREMEEEGLWLIPSSCVIFVLEEEGVVRQPIQKPAALTA